MSKKITIVYLLIAITGNAFGTALMAETDLGMTAWGSSAINVTNYVGISLGTSFIIISLLCYLSATAITKSFVLRNAIHSLLFLLCFGFVTDVFMWILPFFGNNHIVVRIVLNTIGLLILLFSIALHIRIHIAVHPMDVFLHAVQTRVQNIAIGTYIVYLIAFIIAIVFGLLYGEIKGVGIGTINTIAFGGIIMGFYNKRIFDKWFNKKSLL